MKLGFATDIHLDHVKTIKGARKQFRVGKSLAERGFDALIVSGDISTGKMFKEHMPAFIEGVGKPVYFVLGNHDFWQGFESHVWEEAAKYPGFLDRAGVVELTPDVGLCGVTGWYDCRAGNYIESEVAMGEFDEMPRFKNLGPDRLFEWDDYRKKMMPKRGPWPLGRKQDLGRKCQSFADEQTRAFMPVLEEAAKKYPKVFIVTHFPLWEEACFSPGGHLTKGNEYDDGWLPWSCNIELGARIEALAADFPDTEFQTFTGHTHGAGEAQILPNLRAICGAANYGQPDKVRIFDIL